jgi:hypothetical protein
MTFSPEKGKSARRQRDRPAMGLAAAQYNQGETFYE